MSLPQVAIGFLIGFEIRHQVRFLLHHQGTAQSAQHPRDGIFVSADGCGMRPHRQDGGEIEGIDPAETLRIPALPAPEFVMLAEIREQAESRVISGRSV